MVGRRIIRVERTVISYIPMLLAHILLITVPCIRSLKIVNNLLLDRHFSALVILSLAAVGGRWIILLLSGSDLKVDFGANGPVILVKALFAA